MKEINDIYKATAGNFWETMNSHAAQAGFRIPDYQRSYNWGEEHIKRLLENIADGLHNQVMDDSEKSFTFLGTLILVNETNPDPHFTGKSLAIVDGQQRLTTLVLTACVLIEAINDKMQIVKKLPDSDSKYWLGEEAMFTRDHLFMCVEGILTTWGKKYPFPRLIRGNDARGASGTSSEYMSVVGSFLWEFITHQNPELEHKFGFSKSHSSDETSLDETKQFDRKFDSIKRKIEIIVSPDSNENEDSLDCETISINEFTRKGVNILFDRLSIFTHCCPVVQRRMSCI